MRLFLASLLAAAVPASQPLFLPDQVSGPENDYNWSEDDHGHAVFARSKADFAASRIWETQRTAAGWSAPRPVAFASAEWRDSDPWLTPDGRWLYFISDRPAPGRAEGRRDLDLWRVRRVGKGWGTPEPLSALNTPAEELGPELHGGHLYFASTRKGGPGKLDFFEAPRKGDGFGPAAPLPVPLNSAQSEGDLTFSGDGKMAIFWREVGGRLVLHQSRRAGTGWSAPVALPAASDLGTFKFTPAISRDGRSLIFASTAKRPGQADGLADLYQVPLPR